MKNTLQKILLAFFLGLILPQFVFAADIFFEAKTKEVRVGEQFEVKLFVNTPNESINAFEGKIIFPSDLINVKEIRDGNSIINFWIDKPKVENGAIAFSGITPGGFEGNNGLLFSAVFEPKAEGTANFKINDAKVLRNDGIGSQAVLTIEPLGIKISLGIPVKTTPVEKIKDIEPPESFTPEIASDPNIFGGKRFLVFATRDKGSGIDRYEVKETRDKNSGDWITADSPYVLKDQKLRSYIFVKAVDKAGNARIAIVEPKYPARWYERPEIWIIIILAIFILRIFRKILWRRKINTK